MARARARLRAGRLRRPLDHRTIAEAFSVPGIDPRQWVAYATVDQGEQSVVFDPDYGYLVQCTLQPTKVQVTARVGSQIAGNGEGEYYPFVGGDEVLVAIPGGHERSGAVILCRLNNAVDRFPTGSVAGQDPTKNAFGLRRQRTPFVHEVAGPYVLRQATTGALVGMDAEGVVTLKNAANTVLQLSADAVSLQSADGEHLLQLDTTNGRATLKVGDALLTLSASTASPAVSAISVNRQLTLSTNAQPAAEHVISTEAVVHLLYLLLQQIGVQIPGPVTGALLAAQAQALLAATLPVAAVVAQQPALGALLQALFGQVPQKPPATVALGQSQPGLGCSGLVVG